MELTVERVAVDAVEPHPRNVRQGDVGAISESLRAHGQYRPIVVQRSTGYVLAGNHTLLAARALDWPEVDIVYVDVDDEQAVRILLTDNRTADLASYDDRALAELLSDVARDGGLVGTGWDGDDLDRLLDDLAPPEPPEGFPDAEALAGHTEHHCPRCGYEWAGSPTPGD